MEVTRSAFLKVAAGAVAASLSTFGLAYAGVDLPGTAAEEAFEAVLGVELPNQDGAEGADESTTDTLLDESDLDAAKDCEFGQAVADKADEDVDDVRVDEADKADSCEQAAEGQARRADESAQKRSAAARDRRDDAAGEDRSLEEDESSGYETGSSTADGWSGGTSSDGQQLGEDSSQNGEEYNPSSGPDSGEETGEEASEKGQEYNPTSGNDSDDASDEGEGYRPGSGDDSGDASDDGQEHSPSGHGR